VSLSNFSDNDDVQGLNAGQGRQYTFSIPVPSGCDYVNYLNIMDEWDFYASNYQRKAHLENQFTVVLRLNGQEFTVEDPIHIEWCLEEA
jgi:hypothetical protein